MDQTAGKGFSEEQIEGFLTRGFSRRGLARLFALATAGAALPFASEPSLAQLSNIGRLPPGAVKINANEFPLGLSDAAMAKLVDVAERGNRYQYEETDDLVALVAELEELSTDRISTYPGSSLALLHTVLAFTGPDAPLVTVSPGYEAAARGAEFIGASAIKVPLLENGAHDVEKMVATAESSGAGLIYVCNPNNPSGSTTPRRAIDWLIENKPAGSVVLVDEAYIHFSEEPACTQHVAADGDVVILRTFSKIYGMAGLRAGFLMARPDLIEKIAGFKGGALPATAMAAAAEMLRDRDLLAKRREYARGIREDLCSFFDEHGFSYLPTDSFKVMVDTGLPVEQVIAGMREHQVYVGRPWPEVPTHLRVSLGSPSDMEAFKAAFLKVVRSA